MKIVSHLLQKLDKEIEILEKQLANKQEERRELINRHNLNKGDAHAE